MDLCIRIVWGNVDLHVDVHVDGGGFMLTYVHRRLSNMIHATTASATPIIRWYTLRVT